MTHMEKNILKNVNVTILPHQMLFLPTTKQHANFTIKIIMHCITGCIQFMFLLVSC